MIIYKQTVQNILNKQFLLVYFTIFIPVFLSFYYLFEQLNEGLTYYEQLDLTIAGFFVITFLWTLGIPFLIVCVVSSINLVQQEIEDGLMCVLLSKPITRRRLLFEKMLGSISSMVLLGFLSVLVSLSLLIFCFSIPSSIYSMFLKLLPSLIVYTLFIVLIATGISILVTFLLKHRLKAMIVMISFIMLIEFIFPLFKGILLSTGIYTKYHLYVMDINYHFGLIYYGLMKEFMDFTPGSQLFISQFVGIFKNQLDGLIDADLGFIPNQFHLLNYLNSTSLFLSWLFILSCLFSFSYYFFNKKDIK